MTRDASRQRPRWPSFVGVAIAAVIGVLLVVQSRGYDAFPPPPAGEYTQGAKAEATGQRYFVGWTLPRTIGDRQVVIDAATLQAVPEGMTLLNVYALRYDESPDGSAIGVLDATTVSELYGLHLLDEVTLLPRARDWYLAFEVRLDQPGEFRAGPYSLSWRADGNTGTYTEQGFVTLSGGFAELADGRECVRNELRLELTSTGPRDALRVSAALRADQPCAIDAELTVALLAGQGVAPIDGNPPEALALVGVVSADEGPSGITTLRLPCGTGALSFVALVKDTGEILADGVLELDSEPCPEPAPPAATVGPLERPAA